MKKAIVTLYEYAELNEAAKAKALTSLADLNTSGEWWADIYKDAAVIGLTITGFNLMSRNFHSSETINYTLKGTAVETAKLILENHGDVCDTYKAASSFIEQRNRVVAAGEKINADILEIMDEGFMCTIAADYWELLQKDYDYRTSKKAIEESIEANDYHFTTDGQVFSTPYDEIPAV